MRNALCTDALCAAGWTEIFLARPIGRTVRAGHPWIYREALVCAGTDALPNGALVVLRGQNGAILGTGFWDRERPVALRLLSHRPPPKTEATTWARAMVAQRLRAALARRLAAIDRTRTNAFRWIHGEADQLPGIHVDLYDRYAVIRHDGPGARAFYRDLPELLYQSSAPLALNAVIDRDRRDKTAAVTLTVREAGLTFSVDLGRGQKGGLFLDQRENRTWVAERSRGRTVLNLFAYTGGFSVHAAAAGATRVDMVDIAAPAIAAARENFVHNRLDPDVHGFFVADAFDFLAHAARRGQHWDIVISDPPSFAPRARALPAARAAYRRLHRMAATVVSSGGLLCAASCSSHVDRATFLTLVQEGVRQAGRSFDPIVQRGAGLDHPVVPSFLEGDYLKFVAGHLRHA